MIPVRRPRKSLVGQTPRGNRGRGHRNKRTRWLPRNFAGIVLGTLTLVPVAIWLVTTVHVLGGRNDGVDDAAGAAEQRHGPAEPRSLRKQRRREGRRASAAASGAPKEDRAGDPRKKKDAAAADGAPNAAGAAAPAADARGVRRPAGRTVEAATTERIVAELLRLARMPSSDLRDALDPADDSDTSSGSEDPFQLALLRKGQCPWAGEAPTVVEWLPKRPLSLPAEWFRNRHDDGSSQQRPVAVYYEHLSKAGGTSFCKLAQTNMPKREVPSYYCMPSEPGMVDARVGSWSAEKLAEYLSNKPHRLVSNEWEPFNLDFLRFQPMSESELSEAAGNGKQQRQEGPLLLFVTSIRDPIDRLLSAHKFWGILHNEAKKKPTLGTWLTRYGRRAERWEVLSDDFLANVGRFNFATWKFSGGKLPVSSEQRAEELLSNGGGGAVPPPEESAWLGPFETAVRTLARFDLAIPMEFLSDHTGPLQDLLGWTKFEKSHVVPSGLIVNNDASRELSKGQLEALWDANKLDILLYKWTCAIYLTRFYCADVLI